MNPVPIHTVVMYPRPHPDPICTLFLLREFGEQYFLGVKEAKIEYWNMMPAGKTADELEAQGYLLIDIGGGKFDHHHGSHGPKTDCASTLVAKYLGVDGRPELKKLLQYVKRDDLEGKGIISKDIIDRAFGLSALVMNLNRDYPDYPDYVVDTVYRIFLAHYHEEYRRKVLMPQEWEELKASGKANQFEVAHNGRRYRVVTLESDSKTIVGFVRAVKTIQADIVVQRTPSGHTNIITNQNKQPISLRGLIVALRRAEADKRDYDISSLSESQLEQPGRLSQVPEWYFDTAAKTLQNGGAAAQGIEPTELSLHDIGEILKTAPLGSRHHD